MGKALESVNGIVWGIPTLMLILGVGLYLTVCTGFAQFRLLPKALSMFWKNLTHKNACENGVHPYQALCTALAATVGTGNLAGVAGAIAIGGPGSIFWMWICAFLGMVTKFAEATLAVHYRTRAKNGEWIGGPMYMIYNGLSKRWRWLAAIYSFFGVVASFGVGNATQINAVIGGIGTAVSAFGGQWTFWHKFTTGVVLSILVTTLLLGGARRIGNAAEGLVPIASLGYIILSVVVLCLKVEEIPHAFDAIFRGAFMPKAVTGGMLGSAYTALRTGASRGVFTNEAGMGTASIAHASAQVKHPIEQGLMGIIEVFLDTIVICTMTALVILCSGVSIPYGYDVGINLTSQSFSTVCGDWVCVPIAMALSLFAIATVLGWGLYGMRCTQYLFGENTWKKFVLIQGIMVIIGSVLGTGTVWTLAEIVNGLMAIPNLLALVLLSPTLIKLTRNYRKNPTAGCLPVRSG